MNILKLAQLDPGVAAAQEAGRRGRRGRALQPERRPDSDSDRRRQWPEGLRHAKDPLLSCSAASEHESRPTCYWQVAAAQVTRNRDGLSAAPPPRRMMPQLPVSLSLGMSSHLAKRHRTGCRRSPVRTLPDRRLGLHGGAAAASCGLGCCSRTWFLNLKLLRRTNASDRDRDSETGPESLAVSQNPMI